MARQKSLQDLYEQYKRIRENGNRSTARERFRTSSRNEKARQIYLRYKENIENQKSYQNNARKDMLNLFDNKETNISGTRKYSRSTYMGTGTGG